jgi:hypothetical protein
MVPGTVSQPRLLRGMIVRGALMAVLIAISWTALFILMGVTAISAVLAVVIAGGVRLLCFGMPIGNLK